MSITSSLLRGRPWVRVDRDEERERERNSVFVTVATNALVAAVMLMALSLDVFVCSSPLRWIFD